MSLHRNRVQMTVTGAPGTGAITLNAATTGYQSFSSAYGADATVDILIIEGNNWEVCRNCAYTNGTPQVDRGTLEGSSAGPTTRVSFGSGAIVSVIATAAAGNNWGLNEVSASPTGAGVTGVVGTLHLLNIGGLTASRDFTLPATCAVGDRVGVFITTGDDAFELSLKPATGDTINGGSAGAEWSRLFITGECVIFRCITADTDWIVEYDGRIPQAGRMSRITSDITTSTTGWNETVLNSEDVEVGCNVTATGSGTSKIKVRRTGTYVISGGSHAKSGATCADNEQQGFAITANGNTSTGTVVCFSNPNNAGTSARGTTGVNTVELSAGDEIQHNFFFNTTVNLGQRGFTYLVFAAVVEIL